MSDPNFDADDLPSDLKDVPRRNLKRVLHRCKTSEEVTERDRDVLARLWRKIKTETKRNEDFGGHHANDILGDCFRLARGAGGLARTLTDGPEGEAAVDRLDQWVADKDYSGYVADDYYSSLRLFGGFMTDGGRMDWPDRFDELPAGMRDEIDPAPKKTNILHYEEAGEMASTHSTSETLPRSWSSGRPVAGR